HLGPLVLFWSLSFHAVEEAFDLISEAFEIALHQIIHQICFWRINTTANLKIEGKVAWVANRLEIIANRSEKLTSNFLVDRELRVEFQLTVKRDRTGCGEANIRRTQDQLIDGNQSGTDVVLRLGLLKTEFSQLFDLEDSPD